MEKSTFEILKIFGPSVLKVKIPNEILESLNNYVDNIVVNEEKSKKLNYGENLAGDVSQEFVLENDIMKSTGWANFLAKLVYEWVKIETGNKITKFNIQKSWIVRQFKNEYNPIHWHNGHISGAGFLKIPNTFGKHVQKKENREYKGGKLELIHGTRVFMSNSTFSIIPKVGDFYFFPNYLMHTVYPFKETNEERRSISFNAYIDENIYNVYG
tara:strand:+ start:855 stop:1493 length:639 start_codon:yes stop_codon:yes gene_type:complete